MLTEEAQQTIAQRQPPPWPVPPEQVDRGRLDHLLGRDIAHQGAALLADPLATPSLQQALERTGPLIVLDQVTDPRNIGAILRSAAAFGVAAVITQDRNAPEETGSLAKAASGALERIPLLRAVNIARTLIALKAAGLWTVGPRHRRRHIVRPGTRQSPHRPGAGRRGRRPAPPHARDLRRDRRIAHARQDGQPERLRRRDRGALRTDAAGMSGYQRDVAAASLHQARLRREPVAPLPQGVAPRTEAEGADVQRALAHLAGAASPGGFKIGATAKRMQEYLGLAGPAAGFMATGDIHRSGITVRLADFIQPGVECELAVRLAHDLPPGPCTAETAAAAVGELVAGIEIVDNRYGELLQLGVPTLIADQVFHAACVLGEPGAQDWRSLDIGALRGRLVVDGNQRDEGIGADLMGHPMNCLAWLAGSSVAAAFGGLRAGQVVMLGSVTPPVWLTAPASVVVDFSPLPPVRLQLV